MILQKQKGKIRMFCLRSLIKKQNLAALLFLICITLLISACARDVPQPTPDKHSIAVMPFIKGRDPQNLANTLSCPFERFCYEDDALEPDADQIMTRMVYEKLISQLNERVSPLKKTRETYEALLFDHPRATPLDIARDLGQEGGADYVLVGNIWRYRKRQGSSLGVTKPASVAFSLYLVNTANGKTVWEARFNETQQSLSENLFKAPEWFKRGGTWLEAKELARYGLEDLLREFPLK